MSGALNAQLRVLGGDHATFSQKAFGYQLQSPTTTTFRQSARSNRERLDDPSISMLDLDDDSRLSVASDVYDDEQPPPDSNDISHDSSSHRLSYLGPNLRFHSRAPWEIDDTTSDNNECSSGFLSSSKKAFGFSNSPRTSDSYRPSGESTRSQAKSKQSFETTLSQISYPRGALYALAQESLSTSSLGASTPAFRSKGPLKHVRPDSSNNTTLLSSPTLSTHSNHILLTNSSKRDTQLSSTTYHDAYPADDIHPYANPDLGFQVLEESPKRAISRSDSDGTVTKFVAHSALPKSEAKFAVGSASPFLPANTRSRASAIQGREISPPISVVNTLDSKLACEESHAQIIPESLSGWVERVIEPGFSLISLDEARARKRSATAQSTVPLSTPSSSSPLSLMPQAESGNSDSGRYDIEGGFSPHSRRARARSASAGTKAKVAFQSMVGGGQPKLEADAGHGKALKHKKSGFMRLFNGGRGQDREEKILPPPVPSLSNLYADFDTTQKVPKVTTPRGCYWFSRIKTTADFDETDVGTPVSSTKFFSPLTPGSASLSDSAAFTGEISEDSVVSALQQQISNAKFAWQRQVLELERQVRDLKAEVDDLRKADSEGPFCERCGRGQHRSKVEIIQDVQVDEAQCTKNLGVMSRPRARTGISSRFSNALP
ncbi:hypothetical protein C0993_001159 [Termitomyces sp. T159_Od127]|nr:hypothetical protein C0993_001159 [Termitomyces sp. T159_Od127]